MNKTLHLRVISKELEESVFHSIKYVIHIEQEEERTKDGTLGDTTDNQNSL